MAAGLSLAQSDEVNKYTGFRTLFANNPTKVALFPPFGSKVVIFGGHLTALEAQIVYKNVSSAGVTIDKNLMKEEVAIYYDDICQLTRDFAIDDEDNELAENVNYTESSIFKVKDIDIYPLIVAINGHITPLLANPLFIPYGITAPILAAGLAKATAFRDYLHTNSGVQQGQNVAGNTIDTLILPLRADNKSFDRNMTWYKKHSNPFYQLYQESNKINQTGNTITRFTGFVFKAGTTTPIPNATVTNDELTTVMITNLLGEFTFERFMGNLYSFTVSAVGYITQTFVIKISPGVTYNHNFEMTPV